MHHCMQLRQEHFIRYPCPEVLISSSVRFLHLCIPFVLLRLVELEYTDECDHFIELKCPYLVVI